MKVWGVSVPWRDLKPPSPSPGVAAPIKNTSGDHSCHHGVTSVGGGDTPSLSLGGPLGPPNL